MNSSANKKGKQKMRSNLFLYNFFKEKPNTFVILCDYIWGAPLYQVNIVAYEWMF